MIFLIAGFSSVFPNGITQWSATFIGVVLFHPI